MNFARYNWVLVALMCPPLIIFVLVVLFAEPVTGDLTRLGGYFEEQYGWYKPQQGVSRSGFTLAEQIDDYDRYYDVVVLGDSFSVDTVKGWENWFHERTGLSIIAFMMSKGEREASEKSGVDIETIVSSEQFQLHPPKYFVYESVERNSVARLSEYSDKTWNIGDRDSQRTYREIPLNRPDALPRREIWRQQSLGIEARLQQTVNIAAKAVKHVLGKEANTRIYNLNTAQLFSSNKSNRLLVFDGDATKKLDDERLKYALLGIKQMQSYVERNGFTRFMLLLFPDKLTVYSSRLEHSKEIVPSHLPTLAEKYSFPQLTVAYEKALDGGAVDLYLPNDTHAGYLGYVLAAEELIRFYSMNHRAPQ